MCTGVETFIIASLLGSTAMTAAGQIQQGEFQHDVATQKARQDEFNAADARERGAIAEDEHRAKVRQIRGQQMAILGASGVEATSGTPATVLDQTASLGELDATRIRSNAEREAWGMERSALESRVEGKMARTAAGMNAFGTVLAGGSRAMGLYNQYKGN